MINLLYSFCCCDPDVVFVLQFSPGSKMHEIDGCSDVKAGGEDHDGWRGKMM